MQMVMQRGFTWRGSHDNLFGFAKSVTAGRLAKESWLQRLHVKPLIARIQIEFLCGINEFIYCNTLHFFLAKNTISRWTPLLLANGWSLPTPIADLHRLANRHARRTEKTADRNLRFALARQRPTLAGGDPQLPSALESLTSEFGMCSGVTFPPLSPDLYFILGCVP